MRVAMLVVKEFAREISSFNRWGEGCAHNLGAWLTNIFLSLDNKNVAARAWVVG